MKYFVLILFLSWNFASAQILPNFGGQRAGISALSFLKNDLNPVTSGMANAGTAWVGNAFVASNNPAGMTDVSHASIGLSNLTIGSGLNQSNLGSVFTLANQGKIGFGVNTLNTGSMPVRTELQPNGTGEYFSANNTAIGLSYAQKLSDKFSLGVTTKYIYEAISTYRNHTAALDIGFLYKTDFKDLTFAVAMVNFGGNTRLSGTDLAVKYNRSDITTQSYTLPTVFKMGFSMKMYEKDKHVIRAGAELNHPNDNAENIRFGGEYTFANLLFLRTGYKLSVKGQNFPTFGVGYRTKLMGRAMYIDYANNPTNRMGIQHILGLRVNFEKQNANG